MTTTLERPKRRQSSVDLLSGDHTPNSTRPKAQARPQARPATQRVKPEVDVNVDAAGELQPAVAPKAPGRIGSVAAAPASLDERAASATRVWSGGASDMDALAPGEPLARLLVSPEFERRRKAVEREIRRRARQPLMWALLGLTMIVLALLTLFSPFLSVRTVSVVGVDSATAAVVRSAAEPLANRPMFRVDPVAIATRLRRDADISAVRVTKSWPRTVVIEPILRKPLAVVRREGATDRLVDDKGAVLLRTTVDRVVPVIQLGAVDSDTLTADAVAIVAALDPAVRLRLTSLDHDGDQFNARFGPTTVLLGRAIDLPAKAAALARLVDSGVFAAGTQIDISVPDTALIGEPTGDASATGAATTR